MIAQLPPQQRRALAVGLAVAVLLLVIVAIAFPVWNRHRHYDRALADDGDQLVRHLRIAGTREVTEARLAALRAKQTQKDFLKSATPTVAASELQEIVRTAIESSGARQISIQIPAHRDEARYRHINVTVNVTANGPALRRLMHALETRQPRLLVENFSVRQSVGTNFRPLPGNDPEMFVQFDIVGFAVGGGS